MARAKKETVTITITGPQATGKSLLAGALISFLRAHGHNVVSDESSSGASRFSFEKLPPGHFVVITTNEEF